MKKLYIYIFSILFLWACSSANKPTNYKFEADYTVKSDSKNGKPSITGPIEWEQWIDASLWSNRGKTPVSTDALICKQIGRIAKSSNYFFLVFAGSWCEDSESQVPIIYDIFKKAEISNSQIQLFGVDQDKNEPTGTSKIFSVDKAPTLVILLNGTEIGRIEEFPTNTWEQDIINLLYK